MSNDSVRPCARSNNHAVLFVLVTTALSVAFEALEAMRQKAPAGEEAVYRSLISACGRCGNSERAMAVVEVHALILQYFVH